MPFFDVVMKSPDGEELRHMTTEANSEAHAKKIAEEQCKDIAVQEANADGEFYDDEGVLDDMGLAEKVEEIVFEVESVEKLKVG